MATQASVIKQMDRYKDGSASEQQNSLPPLLEIKNLSKDFNGHIAIDNLNLTIQQGEIFALLGGSGCGKSTLLRILAGFERPSSGEIYLNGKPLSAVPANQRPINMMFQSYALFPHMTVEKNIAFGLEQERLPKAEIRQRVQQMLELMQLEEFAKRKPQQLSGGQRQRVALARSLSKQPQLLLLDEPMGALDKNLREHMQLQIAHILREVNTTCVMVTHDQEEAMTMASRIAIMNRGQFTQLGEPAEIYEYPSSRYSAEFIGSVNIFEGTLDANQADSSFISVPALPYPIHLRHGLSNVVGQKIMVAVRPEKIQISLPQENFSNSCIGVIEDIAYMGQQSIFHVRIPCGQKITVTRPNICSVKHSEFHYKQRVSLSWDAVSNVVISL